MARPSATRSRTEPTLRPMNSTSSMIELHPDGATAAAAALVDMRLLAEPSTRHPGRSDASRKASNAPIRDLGKLGLRLVSRDPGQPRLRLGFRDDGWFGSGIRS